MDEHICDKTAEPQGDAQKADMPESASSLLKLSKADLAHRLWGEIRTNIEINSQLKAARAAEQRATQATFKVLETHWLYQINCDLNDHTDKASCACGWTSEKAFTVGGAAKLWIDHIRALSAPAQEAPDLQAMSGNHVMNLDGSHAVSICWCRAELRASLAEAEKGKLRD